MTFGIGRDRRAALGRFGRIMAAGEALAAECAAVQVARLPPRSALPDSWLCRADRNGCTHASFEPPRS